MLVPLLRHDVVLRWLGFHILYERFGICVVPNTRASPLDEITATPWHLNFNDLSPTFRSILFSYFFSSFYSLTRFRFLIRSCRYGEFYGSLPSCIIVQALYSRA